MTVCLQKRLFRAGAVAMFSAFLLAPSFAAASSSYQNPQGYLYKPTFPVYTCQNPTVDCTGSVTIRGTGSPNPARRGGVLTYRLYVRNDDSQNRTVNVKAYIDPNAVVFQDATFAGYSDKTAIRWNSQSIPARSSRTLVLRVRVRSDATLTKPILLRIQTDRSSDVVSVDTDDSNRFYDNAIQYDTRGYVAPTGRSPRIRRATHNTMFYYDENGVMHYHSQGDGYYCDPYQYVCQ